METVKRNDFVEIKYTGYANGNVFDSNIEEDLKKIDPQAKPILNVVIVGQKMLIDGFDNAIEGKEIGKEYEIKISPKDGFGDRKTNLVKTIPLSVFRDKNTDPRPGMVLYLDNVIAKIMSVSGARVLVDFNNPLAGKEVTYKFKIVRKVTDDREKIKYFFESFLRVVPEYDVKDDKVIVRAMKDFEVFVTAFQDKFKELIGKNLVLEVKEIGQDSTPIKDDKISE